MYQTKIFNTKEELFDFINSGNYVYDFVFVNNANYAIEYKETIVVYQSMNETNKGE